jgi:ATP-binding cassette subfamily F protein 3
MLHVNEMTYRVAGRALFERATLAVDKGEHTGLVGPNGSGKTTLLKLIAGSLQPDEGSLSLQRNVRLGLVAQDAPSGPESLLDTVLAADPERTALLEEAETAHDPHRIAEIHERLTDISAASAPARAARILAGLGFDETAQQGNCRELSGGWRMRVALAALLFSQPDLLLLDEPTNHLDLEATLWLEGYLRSYPGTLLLVSHDRNLLNRVAKRIVHLEDLKLVGYSGNYDRFERTRRERLEREAALQKRQMAQRRHIQAFVDRFRYKASKARQAQSRLKALARMEPIATVIEQRTVDLAFPEPGVLPPPLMTLEGVAAGYQAGSPVLRDLDLRLDPDERVALLGANGNGKTTFLRLLSGALAPQDGGIVRSGKLRVGYFAQDQAEQLDPRTTALNLVANLLPKARESEQRSHLGRFGLTGDPAAAGRTDQSPGRRYPPSPGPGDQRIPGRGGPGEPRFPFDRAHRRSPVVGRRGHDHTVRRRPRRLPPPAARAAPRGARGGPPALRQWTRRWAQRWAQRPQAQGSAAGGG